MLPEILKYSPSPPSSRQPPSAIATNAAPTAAWISLLAIGHLPLHSSAAVVVARLAAIAADRHVAPQTAGIAAPVDEQPRAVRTDLQTLQIDRRQQGKRRDRECRLEGERLARG